MFAFAVHYLSGRVYASDYRDRERPEWPPHPARFFSALVSALYESELGAEAREALMWLETLGSPQISADREWPRNPVTTYVPTNEEAHDSVPSLRNLKKQGRSFPSATLKTPLAHFIWPLGNEQQRTEFRRHEAALRDIASRVTYLGSSASLVSVSLTAAPPEPTLLPDVKGTEALRTVSAGRLEELETAYRLGQRPSNGSFQFYRRVSLPQPEVVKAASVFKDFIVFRLSGGLPIKAALLVTRTVRREVARLMDAQAETLIEGRGHHPHCAFVALPDVGFQYSDGHLLGFAALIPKQLKDEERRTIFRALAELKNSERIRLGDVGEFMVELMSGDVQTKGLRAATWYRPSRGWASVTPVIFDRYPKAGKIGQHAEDVIAESCAHAGLPAPKSVSVSKFSTHRGVPPANPKSFPLTDDWAKRYAAHVKIEFAEEVAGPVVIGAGRYDGYGLMRQFEPESEQEVVGHEPIAG
jgi:CRISPR-associated protein Csb2